MTAWLENELDRTATPYTPPPGLHRLNRTEYANAIHDLLDLDIDPAKYLPSDDSTHGFDNIAGDARHLVHARRGVRVGGREDQPAGHRRSRRRRRWSCTGRRRTRRRTITSKGCRSARAAACSSKHEFPSDGEYTITVTPIFGDNMSPTGFGSVPCEKLEVHARRRTPAAARLAGRRPVRRAAAELRPWPRGRGAGPGSGSRRRRGGGGFNRNAVPKMTVRFKTTAGLHAVGVTFPQTNFAPLLDLDQHFQRDTLQTGPTPGFTFFPHVGTVRIEGPFNATDAKDSPSRRKIFVCHPTGAADEAACARRIVTQARHARLSPSGVGGRRGPADEVLRRRPQGRRTSIEGIEMVLARVLASPKFIYRIEAEPANAKLNDAVSHQPIWTWRRACRSSCGAPAPTIS